MPPTKKQNISQVLRVYEYIDHGRGGKDDDPLMDFVVLSSEDIATLRQKIMEGQGK